MQKPTTLLLLLAAAAGTMAADSYPYGYWDANITNTKTSSGWIKNLTLQYFNDNHQDVAQSGKEYHCYSEWTGATLTEVKHCDDWTLEFGIDGSLGPSYVSVAQSVSWGKGKFVSGATASGTVRDLPLDCPQKDAGDYINCTGFVRVNATDFTH